MVVVGGEVHADLQVVDQEEQVELELVLGVAQELELAQLVEEGLGELLGGFVYEDTGLYGLRKCVLAPANDNLDNRLEPINCVTVRFILDEMLNLFLTDIQQFEVDLKPIELALIGFSPADHPHLRAFEEVHEVRGDRVHL